MEQLLIGRLLAERYRVEEILGRGGMSVVYRSLDTRLNRPIALKIVAFPPDMDDSDRRVLRDRLRREATAAASLTSHPNVVQVYDYGTDTALDLDFIAMELLVGEDLKEVLARDGADYPEAIEILRAAARGVAAGHRAGIIHRDVKPANIFLTREGGRMTVKVLDFGIAKALDPSAGDDLTRHDHTPHSPAYASPEQLAMAAQTFASDVYQLGLVGYELLAAERPFTADDRQMIATGSTVPLPEGGRWMTVPPAIRDVIRTALAPDSAERFEDAIQFGIALDAAVDDDATVALPRASPTASGWERAEGDRREDVSAGSTNGGWSEGDVERLSAVAPSAAAADARGAAVSVLPSLPERPAVSRRGPTQRAKAYPILLAGLALVAMIVWLLVRNPATGPTVEALDETDGEAPTVSNTEVLDAEMRPLMLEAYENLRDEDAGR